MGREDRMVKIWYANDETGWAEHLGGNRYRLDNIPLADDLSIDDVVVCRPTAFGMPQVHKRVRSRYPYKTFFGFDTAEQYCAIDARAREAGAKTASLVPPTDGKPGLALCAHGEDFDPLQAVQEAGIENPDSAEEPD
jgi:hypothetical protein